MRFYPSQAIIELFVDLVLPEPEDGPAQSPELPGLFFVPLPVYSDLVLPELAVGLRRPVALGAAVPEAAVDKDDQSLPGERNVRLSGETVIMDPVSQSPVVKGFSEGELRLCVV